MKSEMAAAFQPWALDITTTPDLAFDLADDLGMEGVMTALSVTIFDAPQTRGKTQMLVQALFETEADAVAAQDRLELPRDTPSQITQLPGYRSRCHRCDGSEHD